MKMQGLIAVKSMCGSPLTRRREIAYTNTYAIPFPPTVPLSMTALSPRHAMALAYARAGIPIFPCITNDKRPATIHGFKDRTLDENTINKWWQIADYNIGVVPDDMGCLVIDIDPKNQGDQTWAEFEAEFPATRTVITPSGGRHLYFYGSAPPSSGKLGPGLDVRGRSSYVLVPPSIINGVPYQEVP